jgi:hypothetical protein
MHEWDPHFLPDLFVCRLCKCVRYLCDSVKENRNISGGFDRDFDTQALTRMFKRDLQSIRSTGKKLIYCYSNKGYYIIRGGELRANWTFTHPICVRKEEIRATRPTDLRTYTEIFERTAEAIIPEPEEEF